MSVYYDLYTSGNPQKKEEQQALYARVIPSGTINADKFVIFAQGENITDNGIVFLQTHGIA